MNSEERDDAGGGRDVAEGYPEEQPDGAGGGGGGGGERSGGDERKPATDSGEDSDPGTATGNPGAAG